MATEVLVFPLSFAQHRLWFLDQLEPGNPFYNITWAVRVSGPLRVGVLQQTIEAIVTRHESLRTTFAEVEGNPVQVVTEGVLVSLPVTDLSEMPTDEREEKARQLVTEAAQVYLDLSRAPLFRASLLRLAEDEHIAIFTMHHIISDGWSTQVSSAKSRLSYPSILRGPAFAFTGASHPVCRLHSLADRVAPGRRARLSSLLLARATQGSATSAGVADGPSSARRSDISRSRSEL